ncbi:MAG: hypothetical protein WC792_02030 [Candidatus Micrarchaeia archaeon]|jgi:drug/metabolite transporter (DMT)-like permease
MEWYVYSFIAMLLIASSNVLLKISSDRGLDMANLQTAFNPSVLAVLVPAMVLAIAGSVAMMVAFKAPGAKTGAVVAIVSLTVVLVTVYSIMFLGEQYSAKQIAGITLALGAIGLLVF